MGPIHLADYVGLDICYNVLNGWVPKNGTHGLEISVPDILAEKVKEGKLGRKSGEGFYKWDGDRKL